MVKIFTVLLFLVIDCPDILARMQTDTFSFSFDGKRLAGVIDLPAGKAPRGILVIVPGSGRTDIVAGDWFHGLRRRVTELGIACAVWDKMGCGKSEGVFNGDPSVQKSAEETIAAIAELRRRNIPGADRVGLWGISRAGWICPLVIERTPIAFWISVSGTDDKESFGYLLEKNFQIEGRSEAQAKMLANEWLKGIEIATTGGTFEENLEATRHLRNDSFYIFITNNSKPSAEEYYRWQSGFSTGENLPIDKKTGLPVYVPEFEKVLRNVNCPVLAIFGEKDSQVDWQKTMALYKKTIGKNPIASLTIKTFPDGNHNIQACKTGGFREKIENRTVCNGYYETITSWLNESGMKAR